MDMQSKRTMVIDREAELPFVLKVIVGHEEKGETVLLERLCKSPYRIADCIYDIQELKPLRLQMQSEVSMHVIFTWNKLYEGKKRDAEWTYTLHPNKSSALLYEHGKTDYLYPWRCGLYHFEVQTEDETYYGAFRITPKNFSDEGLELIQNKVKSVMGSLIMDRGVYKKTFSSFQDLEDHSYMQTIRWLSHHIQRIKQLYARVERDDSYEEVYAVEKQARKQYARTARKSMLLQERGEGTYYNRCFRDTNNDEAKQYMKQKTKEFVQLLLQLVRFLEENIEKLEHMQQSSKREKEAVHSILQTIERNGSVTERDKQKYRNIHLLKDTDVKKLAVKLREYTMLYTIVQASFRELSARLRSPYWSAVADTYRARPSILSPACKTLLHLLETTNQKCFKQMNEPSFLFVYKPTFLIYEYYVYFAVLFLLEEMKFVPLRPIAEQVKDYFYLDGLQDGTAVILEHDNIRLHVVFNELIETHPMIALSKGSHFYNGEDTKKPDIRIDYYKKHDEEYYYQSSVIIEVKYSPMYNIFQSVGNTKATEQMYKYWSIKYVREEEKERIFHRRAIHEVICVYPGSHVHAKKIETGCGVFLQFYPLKTRQGFEYLVGKGEMIRLLQEWLPL